ncbi:acyl-CoA N-acyltransferase [Delitschia confertaspora ATCC 74209]|uniref:Acyl-CoA N-acyltransferase n=1 Tax=Delitschia confertaspora ATCC 74209 TaxID=1513339 RepID=A0A9P4JQ13_9PLEO|nr:acyl-CoA N-acyltransferase [Delitschia confertaspora ATCC 74209]
MPSSNITIAPLTPSSSPLYAAVRHESFKQTLNYILYAREPSQASLDQVAENVAKDIETKPNYFYFLAKDSEGNACAGAKWQFNGTGKDGMEVGERSWEEVERELTVPEGYKESDPRVWKAFFNMLNGAKREILGQRPYLILQTLVTHPNHERKGAGSALLRWGLEQADAKGVETYLEASQIGAPLYARYGFQPVKDLVFDLRDFGYDGPEDKMRQVFTLMIRSPQGKVGSPA